MTRHSISSPQNQRVKDAVRLRDRRHRDREGRFLVEGYRAIRRALDAGVAIETLYVCPPLFLGPNEDALIADAEAAGAEVVDVEPVPFTKMAYRDRPEGLLAVAPRFSTAIDDLDPPTDCLILVVEGIEKPGNLGTMIRTADAAGCNAVIVCDPTTDPFNPNVVRSSTGVLFDMPLAVTDTATAITWLEDRGVTTVATTPDAASALWEVPLTPPLAVVVGAEQVGLTDEWLAAADLSVSIPMAGRADSLNAAMATGIVLFEAVRQRRG